MIKHDEFIDITGTPLTPGDPRSCLGGDNHPEHPLCCDNCPYYLECYPDGGKGEQREI